VYRAPRRGARPRPSAPCVEPLEIVFNGLIQGPGRLLYTLALSHAIHARASHLPPPTRNVQACKHHQHQPVTRDSAESGRRPWSRRGGRRCGARRARAAGAAAAGVAAGVAAGAAAGAAASGVCDGRRARCRERVARPSAVDERGRRRDRRIGVPLLQPQPAGASRTCRVSFADATRAVPWASSWLEARQQLATQLAALRPPRRRRHAGGGGSGGWPLHPAARCIARTAALTSAADHLAHGRRITCRRCRARLRGRQTHTRPSHPALSKLSML
jgi:hypothetical protein